MIVSRTAFAKDILRLAVETKLAISEGTSDRAALTIAGVARALSVWNAISVMKVLSIVFASCHISHTLLPCFLKMMQRNCQYSRNIGALTALILGTAFALPSYCLAAGLHFAFPQNACKTRWTTLA